MDNDMNVNAQENQAEETKKGFNWTKAIAWGTAAVAAVGCIGVAIYKKATKNKNETQEESCVEEPAECECEEAEEASDEE